MNLGNWYPINEKISVKEDCTPIAGTAYWRQRLLIRGDDGAEGFYQPDGAQLCCSHHEAIAALEEALVLGFIPWACILKRD